MPSDDSRSEHRSGRRRRDDRDDHHEYRDSRRYKSRHEEDCRDGNDPEDVAGKRDRSSDRCRHHRRGRSRSPDRSNRRRERSRDRDREQVRHRERDSEREKDRGRERDRDSDRDSKSRRHHDHDRKRRTESADRSDRSDDDRDRRRERKRRRSRDNRERMRDLPRDTARRRDDPEAAAVRKDSKPRSPVRRGGPLPSQADSFALVEAGDGEGADGEAKSPPPKERPNFGTTGVLAAASNSVQQADGTTVTLKYHEPAEARKPPARDDWRFYVFKGERGDLVDTIPLSSRSCWLVGRDPAVADLLAEHPSVSKQHAAVQFRHVERRNEFGDRVGGVKPYLVDLESANGTLLNGERVPDSRYLELRDKDVVRFGLSSRDYVVMLAPKD